MGEINITTLLLQCRTNTSAIFHPSVQQEVVHLPSKREIEKKIKNRTHYILPEHLFLCRNFVRPNSSLNQKLLNHLTTH